MARRVPPGPAVRPRGRSRRTDAEVVMARRTLIFRHALVVRVTHWINVLCMTVLLASGLQIFNAHPALYWGDHSDFASPILALDAVQQGDNLKGVTRIFGA